MQVTGGTSVCLLAMLLVASQSAPVRESRELDPKLKCLTRSEAKGWKKCDKPATLESTPSYEKLGFEEKLEQSAFPEIQVPQNGFECFRVHRFDVNSDNSKCPAYCSVRGVVERNEGCEDDHPLINHYNHVTVKSPRISCVNDSYRPENEICIYNVSMSCEADHVSVSQSHLNLAPGDFLQIIDFMNQDSQAKVFTNTADGKWPRNRSHIFSDDFLVVFWTENGSKDGYDGFKIGLECASGVDHDNTDKSSGDGSGEDQSGSTPS